MRILSSNLRKPQIPLAPPNPYEGFLKSQKNSENQFDKTKKKGFDRSNLKEEISKLWEEDKKREKNRNKIKGKLINQTLYI